MKVARYDYTRIDMSLPEYLLEAFEKIPTDQNINVLMRHSIRFPITSDAEVFTAQLTPEGEDLASAFGAWLQKKYTIGKIFSSPITRCKETGRHLSKGAGNGKVILPDPVLAHPNENGEYDSLGEFLVSGDWPLRILQIAEKMFPDDHSVGLNFLITHDTVLALMAAYWLEMDIRAPQDWPQYLEPMFFWKKNGKMVITFRGNEYSVDQ
jgi:broad specificity phosphatase PhoE